MIVYIDRLDGITADNLHGFFVGWPNPPSPETHLKLLANSDVSRGWQWTVKPGR